MKTSVVCVRLFDLNRPAVGKIKWSAALDITGWLHCYIWIHVLRLRKRQTALDCYLTARVAQVMLLRGVRFLSDVHVKWQRPSFCVKQLEY